MIDYIDEKITLHPLHKPFFKDVPKKDLQPLIEYLYYYYIDDTFQNILPTERYDVIVGSYVKGFDIEKHKEIIDKFENVYTSSVKKLAIAHLKKIEEIIKVFYDNPVTVANIEEQAKMAKSMADMYKLSDIIAEKIAKENKVQQGRGSKEIGEFEEVTF